jgi:hypothetical protein
MAVRAFYIDRGRKFRDFWNVSVADIQLTRSLHVFPTRIVGTPIRSKRIDFGCVLLATLTIASEKVSISQDTLAFNSWKKRIDVTDANFFTFLYTRF